jgi:hypothetical protein
MSVYCAISILSLIRFFIYILSFSALLLNLRLKSGNDENELAIAPGWVSDHEEHDFHFIICIFATDDENG